jgi:hypothetical protein
MWKSWLGIINGAALVYWYFVSGRKVIDLSQGVPGGIVGEMLRPTAISK